eukprot:TRINITY_DN96690_c0_g1_i1.p1 TRINITY_DN96690_c0_g1~~TRINITY_DN96690_c0_g1_i1.p1  ORF type:complete len:166 (+),score=27.33 TRINITY_DN96690_c0_g1_i1:89-586(+)
MGAGRSAEAHELDEELGIQDDIFPWFHLVQWCAEDAEANCVFRWDLPSIQEAVYELTKDPETFLSRCKEPLPSQDGFTMDDDTNFAEWAGALLETVPSLCRVRFRLVPSRLKENVFWSRYFAEVRCVVRGLVFHPRSDSEDEGQQQPPEESTEDSDSKVKDSDGL